MKCLFARHAADVVLTALGLAAAGCAPQAKVVTAITNSTDQVKFLYVQGASQGIIRCTVGPGGALG